MTHNADIPPGRHTCKPPRHAEDFDQWRCPTCAAWWMANEDDGWTRSMTPGERIYESGDDGELNGDA